MRFNERIYGDYYNRSLELEGTAEWIEITADEDDDPEVTITLDPISVRKLRLALARYECARAKALAQ